VNAANGAGIAGQARGLSLRSKFVVALLLAALLGLVLTIILGRYVLDRVRNDLGVAYARDVTLLKQAQMQAPLMRDFALSLRMSDSQVIRDWLLDETNVAKREMALADFEGYRKQFASQEGFVISNLSKNYYSNSKREAPSKEPRYQIDPTKPAHGWFPKVMAMPTPYGTNVSYDSGLKVTNVWINVLMKDGDRRIGLVGTGVNLTQFINDFVADSRAGVTPILVDTKGNIYAHPDRNRVADQAATNVQDPSKSLDALLDDEQSRAQAKRVLEFAQQNPGQAQVAMVKMNGKPMQFAASYIPDLRWHVISAVDLDHANLLGWQQLLTYGLIGLGLLIITALGFAYVMDRMVVRRLLSLQRSVQALATGDYQIAAPALEQNRKADEISDLGASFVDMAGRIQRHTQELEDTVRARTVDLQRANTDLQATNSKVAESINYARIIQSTILPTNSLARVFGDQHHVLWRPRDIVGGDFYLLREIRDRQGAASGVLLGIVDCAGHGVPGALMTMLGNAAFEQAISEQLRQGAQITPTHILQNADRIARGMLHVGERERGAATTMDAGLIYFDLSAKQVLFAGAKIDLLMRSGAGEVTRILGGKRSLADNKVPSFEDVTLPWDEQAIYVMFTDGVLDQNGEQERFSFGRKPIENLLKQTTLDARAIGSSLQSQFESFQGQTSQRDDVTLLCVQSPRS
jgi:phosphoserine phosphatase RsbU/P